MWYNFQSVNIFLLILLYITLQTDIDCLKELKRTQTCVKYDYDLFDITRILSHAIEISFIKRLFSSTLFQNIRAISFKKSHFYINQLNYRHTIFLYFPY